MMKLGILGSIGSGKSTISEYIAEKEGIILFEEKFKDNPFLELFYEAIGRGEKGEEHIYPLQMWFFNGYDKEAMMRKGLAEYIVDAGCIAGLAFTTCQVNHGEMSKEIGMLYQTTWIQNFLEKDLIDRECNYFVLDREVDDLMYMIKMRGRDYEANMPRTYISELRQAYLSLPKRLTPYGVKIQVVTIKPGTSIEGVAELIMEKM